MPRSPLISSAQSQTRSPRIVLIDSLRGLALFGILLANIPFDGASGGAQLRAWSLGNETTDAVLILVLHWFIDKKFITLFAILFGFGFFDQWQRAEAKSISFRPFYLRRMLWLLLIGGINAYLIWFGDILRDYAICGMLLLWFAGQSDRSLLRNAIWFIVFGTGLVFILNGVLGLQGNYAYDPSLFIQLGYAGSYSRFLQLNVTVDPFVNFLHDTPLTLVFALGCMLFGFWLGRKDFFRHPGKYPRQLNFCLWGGLTVGMAASIAYWMVITGRLIIDLPLLWLVFLIIAGMFLQSLGYLALFMRLFALSRYRKWLKIFVPIGRMALTNYVMQAVFFNLCFFHWFPGPRWYGKLSMLETWLVALGLFAAQVLFSQYWLARHERGPLEAFWRNLSYRYYRAKAPAPAKK